ncbi:MAG TPA: YcfL family protein [Nitrospiria bacterium]|nr:YcfL family protein [Nitrospiria bacterium]
MKKYLSGLVLLFVLGQSAIVFAGPADSKVEQLGTSKFLEIVGISSKITDNLLVIHLQIKNKDNNDNTGFYRVRWLDESGDPVWEDEVWKPLLLHGNQKISLKMVAPTVKAKDFRIELSTEENYRE